jgi:hypothetical protein
MLTVFEIIVGLAVLIPFLFGITKDVENHTSDVLIGMMVIGLLFIVFLPLGLLLLLNGSFIFGMIVLGCWAFSAYVCGLLWLEGLQYLYIKWRNHA